MLKLTIYFKPTSKIFQQVLFSSALNQYQPVTYMSPYCVEKDLVSQNCLLANHQDLSELIYTLIEGLMSRFLVDGFDPNIASTLKKNINNLFER